MRFVDRFTGQSVVQLPSTILPGRYRLLSPFVVNRHSELKAGQLLLDDGSDILHLDNSKIQIEQLDKLDKKQVDSDLTTEAILAISRRLAHEDISNISPMLPPEIAEECQLEDLEVCLIDVIRDGHLHSISERPRIDLRYDDIVAPVGRARRLASSALTHLASHSDCWQQRTLGGIRPRKILARFSEDDYAFYENRLYKRLLDRLDRHLSKRLARIKGVNSRLEKALEFQDSEHTHHKLRDRICRLWGESYQDDDTGKKLEAGKDALSKLESLLRMIRGLKQRGLYTSIPVAASVPDQLHRTNILNHDSHYRHLPVLWEKLKNDIDDRQITPEERLDRHNRLQVAYSEYVGLVIRRVLEQQGQYLFHTNDEGTTFDWAGRSYSVKHSAYDWIIEDSTGGELKLIPIAWFGTAIDDSELLDSGNVLCWPGTVNSVTSSQQIPISPLDLYVVEKMGKLIDEWLLRPLIECYGQRLGPLPTHVKQLTEKWPNKFDHLSQTYVRLISPLDEEQKKELLAALQSLANDDISAAIESAVNIMATITRLCGHATRLISNDEGFYCQCEPCHTIWSLNTSGNKKIFKMNPKGGSNHSSSDAFLWSGRDSLYFEIDT